MTEAARPFEVTGMSVRPEWIDYNGHMNVAYYVLAFDKAGDALFDEFGLGAQYRHDTNRSIFALEMHVTYDREVREGAPLAFRSLVVDADEKRVHVFHEMRHATEGFLAATNEIMFLHVDLAAPGGPRAVPFPPERHAAVAAMARAHAGLPRPPQLGRLIGIRRRKEG